MSCGQIALKELNIPVDKYYASEIYNKAIEVTQDNFPNTVQCGSLLDLCQNESWLKSLPKIDMVLFGFPCRNNSKAVKGRTGYDGGLKGASSWLFYPCADILDWIRKHNNANTYYLCENVDGMSQIDRREVTDRLGNEYIEIEANLFSAADRARLYWTNISFNKDDLPKENKMVLGNILDKSVSDEYFYNQTYDFHGYGKKVCATLHIKGHDILKRVNNPNFKGATLTSCRGGNLQKKVFDPIRNQPRKLTENEYRKCQCIPQWYKMNVAKSHIYNMCGDGWNIEVIKWFFQYIKQN